MIWLNCESTGTDDVELVFATAKRIEDTHVTKQKELNQQMNDLNSKLAKASLENKDHQNVTSANGVASAHSLRSLPCCPFIHELTS